MVHGALSIKLRCTSWQQLATIYKRDLSRGTMFLRASTPPPIGTSVRIDLTLPSGSVIGLVGVVQFHVSDARRGLGVELKLAPIPTGSIWLIESALASEQRQQPTPSAGVPQPLPPATATGPVATVGDGEDMADAEVELSRALLAEVDSLKKLNPFLVLGVGYDAGDPEVRAAFGQLTKRYHPDRFARFESKDLRQVAAEIFILIRDAYRRLGDEASRTQVLASLGRVAIPRPRPAPQPMPAPPKARPPQAIPIGPAPHPGSGPIRAIADHRSGPIRAVLDASQLASNTPPRSAAERSPREAPPPQQPEHRAEPSSAGESLEAIAVEELVDAGRFDEALASYRLLARKHPKDRTFRAGIELCEGLRGLAARDRLEAAQRFEAALEIDPSNERAARELADMRRQATHERKGLLSRLMGKKEA
jgi:tetratricopeptide (TPR) repeat protein